MKKAAVAAAGFLLTAVLLTGCQQEKVKELIEPLIADVQTERNQKQHRRQKRKSFPTKSTPRSPFRPEPG